MKQEDQILIEILADFVNERSMRRLPGVSLEVLYETAQKHNVTGIVAAMLMPVLKGREKDPLYRKFQEAQMATVFRSVLLKEEVERFAACMEEAQIPYAFFKGYELREWYPVPELRTMSDVDVLVRDEDMEKTAEVLTGLGYTREEGGNAVWTYQKEPFSYEVHRRLAYGKYWNKVDYEGYFAGAVNRLIPGPEDPDGKKYRRYLSREDHFIFLCFHLAKHLHSSGAGIRMVMDIALFLKQHQREMDWGYLWEQARMLQMERFIKTILCAVKEWFGIPSEDDLVREKAADEWPVETATVLTLEKLAHYIMTGGIFGFERDDSIRRLRKGVDGRGKEAAILIKARAFWKLIFPPLKHMTYFMPALEKYPVLLPAAWVKRWCLGWQKRWKVQAAFRGFDKGKNVDEARQQYLLLKKIGL